MGYYAHTTAEVSQLAVIGDGTRIWNQAQVRQGAVIGKDCNIGKNVYIDEGALVGDRVKIQNNVNVYSGVTVESDVFLGPSMTFTNDLYPRAAGDWQITATRVEQGASIGAGAVIVCGNTIGKYAMVGAGSVVASDVKPHALVVGNPARQIGWVCKCGRKLEDGVCPACGAALDD